MISFRPATRQPAPLIIGLAGPSKSGKSLSAMRLAVGLGGPVLMLNTEPHGHHYADRFTYQAHDLSAPHRPDTYTEALQAAAALNPGVVIVDSMSHMHEGAGGMNEWKDEIALEMAKGDRQRAERMTAPAWALVKAAENRFVYQLLSMRCHVILTFRAKEKIKITKDGKWHDLGWRPIMSDRIAFETMFTLMFLPYSGGVPDLTVSELRWPFKEMIPSDKTIDEELGQRLAAWARGDAAPAVSPPAMAQSPVASQPGATSGGGTGGVSIRPTDECLALLLRAHDASERVGLWDEIRAHWTRYSNADQRRLLEGNARAKKRLGES